MSAVHILRPFSRRAGLVSTSPLLLKQTPFDLISLHGLSAPHLRFQLLAFEAKLSSRSCTTVGWHYIGAAASSQSAARRETGFERGEAEAY